MRPSLRMRQSGSFFERIREIDVLRLDHGIADHRAGLDLLDDRAVTLDHGGGGKAEEMRARGEELVEQLGVGIEHRLAAVEIGRGQLRFLQQPQALVLAKQVGRFRRAADETAHVAHEGRVEQFVERHRTDDGHADRRHRGDDREQRHDADMQARRSRLRAPGADQPKSLEGHQSRENRDNRGVHDEQILDVLVGRRERGQPGEDQEAADGAQNRDGDHEGAKPRQHATLAAARWAGVGPVFFVLGHRPRGVKGIGGGNYRTD